MRNLFTLTIAGAAIALASGVFCSSAEAQWGNLKGKILLDGDLPNIPLLVVKGNANAKDPAVCAAQDVPDEKLVVDPESKGIANVVVYLVKKPAKIHPTLEKSATPSVTFDQKGCRFLPHVLLVRTDQEVHVLSGDDCAHNTHTYPGKNSPGYNSIISPNNRKGEVVKAMTLSERVPVPVGCDIHPWMKAFWVVLDHPYAAVTNEKGEFEINNLPVGSHEFIVWQESSGYLEKKYAVTIKDGDNEQKPLKFTAAQILK